MNSTARNGRRITGKLNHNDTLEAKIETIKQFEVIWKSSSKI